WGFFCYRFFMLKSCACVVLLLVFMSSALAKERYQQPRPIHLDRDGARWAEKTLRRLSTEEKVGQLFMIWARVRFLNVQSADYLQLRDSLQKYHVGSFCMTVPQDGPFLQKNQPYEAAELLNRLQADSKLPLIFAADFERGISMRLFGTTV